MRRNRRLRGGLLGVVSKGGHPKVVGPCNEPTSLTQMNPRSGVENKRSETGALRLL